MRQVDGQRHRRHKDTPWCITQSIIRHLFCFVFQLRNRDSFSSHDSGISISDPFDIEQKIRDTKDRLRVSAAVHCIPVKCLVVLHLHVCVPFLSIAHVCCSGEFVFCQSSIASLGVSCIGCYGWWLLYNCSLCVAVGGNNGTNYSDNSEGTLLSIWKRADGSVVSFCGFKRKSSYFVLCSGCLSVCVSNCPTVYVLVYPRVCLVCLTLLMSICWSIHVCLCVWLSICLSVCLWILVFIFMCLFVGELDVSLFIHLF